MDIERIAALLWRFLGVIVIGMAIPGAVMQSAVIFYSAIQASGEGPAALPGSTVVTLVSVALILLGVAMIQLSRRLGELIARGL